MSEVEREQVEKVARAICAARAAGRSSSLYELMEDHERDLYRRMARAAIEALKSGPPPRP